MSSYHQPKDMAEATHIGAQVNGITLPNAMDGQRTVVNEVVSKIKSGAQLMQLTGLPLVGKSYLAQQVAAELLQNAIQWYGDTLQVHTVKLRSQMLAIQLIRQAILDSLGCEDRELASNPPRFWRFLESFQDMHLFILDNADLITTQNEYLQDEFLDFCTYMCHASVRIRIIITARQRYSFIREPATFHGIEVQPLSVEDSRSMFRSIAGDLGLWEHQLVPLCGGIPYVINNVARAIRDNVQTADEMFSHLKSSGLCSYTSDRFSTNMTTTMSDTYAEIEKCIMRLSDMCLLKSRCADLAYIPGTFNPEAAAYITGLSIAATKHDVIDPLHSMSIVLRGDAECERFQIHTFVKALFEDRYGFLRDESLIRNRYCKFFAQLLQRVAPLADQSRGQKFHLVTQELVNLEKLLQQAVHLIDEYYELFFDIAYNAEYHIINLMPKRESVIFYEALMNTAKERDRHQCGVLLSSFGQVLNFAQTRYSKAYDQYLKGLEYLRPLGDSHDLAWLYSHIGYYWFETGQPKKAERYMLLVYKMIKRVKKRTIQEMKQYEERGIPLPQGVFQRDFMTDRFMGCIQSSLGILYTDIGRAEEAVQYHKECLDIRWVIYGFHPTIGSCYNNMSEAYEMTEDCRTALEHARTGMNIKKYFMKDPSNAVIDSLVTVARLTMKTGGDSGYALGLLREAYEMRRDLGLPHLQAYQILHDTGKIRYHREEHDQSVEAFQGALVMLDQIESTRKQRSDTLRMLGLSLQRTGMLHKAVEMIGRSTEELEMIPEGERSESDKIKIVTTRNELSAIKQQYNVNFG